jgi:hypothetical protein
MEWILPLRTSAPTARPRPSCEDSDKIPEGRDLYLHSPSLWVLFDTTEQKTGYSRNLTPEDLCSDCQASAQL